MNKVTGKVNPSSKGSRVRPTSKGAKEAPPNEADGGPTALSTLKKAQKTTRGVIDRVRRTDTFATRGANARATERRNATTTASKRNKTAPVRRRTTPKVTTMPMKSAPTARRTANGNNLSRQNSRGSTNRSKATSAGSKKSNTPSKQGSKSRTPVPRTKSPSSISTKSTVKEVEVKKEKKVIKKLRPTETIKRKLKHGRRESTKLTASFLGLNTIDFDEILKSDDDDLSVDEIEDLDKGDDVDPNFVSCYTPLEMRSMALVAHNHMKAPMKTFVMANQNLLKKFRLTGTNTTMTMLKEVFGEDPDVVYGRNCSSGPLGGDAELVQVMCLEELGACVFFQDPMSAHPHGADIECLARQANVHNIIMTPNPSSAYALMTTLRLALEEGKAELIPSFFETLVSPSVNEYKKDQARVLASNMEHEGDNESDHDYDEYS